MALIVEIAEQHIESFRAAVDSVARERRYLALLEAPPEADTRKYVQDSIAGGVPHLRRAGRRQGGGLVRRRRAAALDTAAQRDPRHGRNQRISRQGHR